MERDRKNERERKIKHTIKLDTDTGTNGAKVNYMLLINRNWNDEKATTITESKIPRSDIGRNFFFSLFIFYHLTNRMCFFFLFLI